MDRFCIVANRTKDKNFELAEHIKKYLEDRGKTCVIATERTGEDALLVGREQPYAIPADPEQLSTSRG